MAQLLNTREHLRQSARRASNRRRTKCGDAVFRKPPGERRDGTVSVERINAFRSVNVHIDEARDDDVAAQRFANATDVSRCRADLGNPLAFDHERAVTLHATRQDEVGAS
jgi:hypothetical protein